MVKIVRSQSSRAGSSTEVESPTLEELERLRAEFQAHNCVKLPELLEPALAHEIVGKLSSSRFRFRRHKDVGDEECMEINAALGQLEFLVNDPRLLKLVEQVTDTGPIGCFTGRVYRMVPSAGHFDSWHSDLGHHRLLAMSVNLSPEPYEGGILQIRDRNSAEVLHEEPNLGVGDAIVFRLAENLQHQITTVSGNRPKTAYAGWFRSEPSFDSILLGTASHADMEPARDG